MSGMSTGSLVDLFDKLVEETKRLEKTKKKTLIRREYSFSKAMLFAIQALTGEKTHDIMATLVAKADEVLEKHEVDIHKVYDYWCPKCTRDYMYYPNTKLYLGAYVKVSSHSESADKNNYNSKQVKFNRITYSFKLPSACINLNEKEYDNIAADGILINFSEDLDAPKAKAPMTPAEKKRIQQEKLDAKSAKKLKKLKPI